MQKHDAKMDFLRSHGADTLGHSQGTLLIHLRATSELLSSWGASPELADAGLFHSVYGTEVFRQTTVPVDLRPRVQRLIGLEAERLAYVFGAMTHESFKANQVHSSDFRVRNRWTEDEILLTDSEWRSLCLLFLANALEQAARMPTDRQRSFAVAYEWLDPIVGPVAAADFERFRASLS